MKNEQYFEYFIDGTYKIVPKKYKQYKIFTVSTIGYKNNK